jgi:gliding motility-associated-like protein
MKYIIAPYKKLRHNLVSCFLGLFFILALFNTSPINSQTISVDVSSTPTQLVNLLLGSSCIVASNQNISSQQSIGSFNNNGSSFPIGEGVIIRNGNVLQTQGAYTDSNLSSQINTNGDVDLQAISDGLGQTSNITDVSFLEFDFIPNGTEFSFDFLFASNEYGQWQCGFTDVFAFLLTDLTTGITTNLAVIPGTTNPISVRDIRDATYNQTCNSENESLFSTYNVNDPLSSTLNMRGHTIVMNASSGVIPSRSYRLRLVIGDYNDSDFDSAIFIAAGSMEASLNLGEDLTVCGSEQVTLDTGIMNTANYSFEWRRDGNPIVGESNPSLTTNIPATYDVLVTTNATNCVVTDQVVVSELQLNMASDLLECDNGANTFFDLTTNNEASLGIDAARFEILYYDSLTNANANIPIPSSQWNNYQSSGGETIYIRVRNRISNQFCNANTSFDLNIFNVTATTPNDFFVCENETSIDIPAEVAVQILNGLIASDYTLNYFNSENEANTNSNPIINPNSFPTPTSDTRIWARLTNTLNTACFDVVDFNIQISSLPMVDDLPDVIECSSYTLPILTNGNYFLESNGQGTQLNAGDVISTSDTIFIFDQNANGCTNETSFNVTIIQNFTIETEYCGAFTVPSSGLGNFYTQPNGPNGTGSLLSAGTMITSNQPVYFYAEQNGTVCLDRRFDIEVFPLPIVDEIDDVLICNSYTLPSITNGSYFTGTGGTGSQMTPGTVLTNSQNVYIFNDDGRCTNESTFQVLIIDPTRFNDVTRCGSYTLPNPSFGGYFTEPGGNGDSLPVGTVITQSTTIYYYIEPSIGPNCTTNLPINITILPLPPVTNIDDVAVCADQSYQLPIIEFGNYFTQPNGQGTQLSAGDVIDTPQTIYIYNTNSTCSNETSFDITITPVPLASSFADVYVCDFYALPPIPNGNYFTEPNGQGMQLNPGDIISQTQLIYINNQDPILLDGCQSETQFMVYVLGITVDELDDVTRCDSYTLPALSVGNYFTESNGQGTQLNVGDIITSTQTLFIYAENGDRFFCSDEHSFTVTITETPPLQNFQNQESCGSYTLPTLNIPNVDATYYRQSGGVNLIDPSEYTITQPGIYTIHVRLTNSDNPDCFIDEVFSITIYPLQELTIQDAVICVDAGSGITTRPATLTSGLDPSEYTVNWYFNNTLVGTGPNYEASEIGIYTVETIKLTPDVGNDCNYAPTEVEVRASMPQAKITFLTEPFDPPANIRVDFIDPGLGTYEYRLNNGSFQTSNIFLNVPFGDHTVTIRDTSGICTDLIIPFRTIGYPSFFTPNGDGINDTWNIPDLSNLANSNIKIFDRYGRLIKEISPSGEGWDGVSNNGSLLPSSSYWFKVEYTFEGVTRTLISYFALQRN